MSPMWHSGHSGPAVLGVVQIIATGVAIVVSFRKK